MSLKPRAPKRPLRRALFWFDGGKKVEGWSTGEHDENGWALPWFDKAQLKDAVAAIEKSGDIRSGFHSGDILELWWGSGRDEVLEEFAPIEINGKPYWHLDTFTWYEEPLPRRGRRAPSRSQGHPHADGRRSKSSIPREERAKIARLAGDELSADSTKEELHKWFERRFDTWDRHYEGGYTLDGLWDEIANSVGMSARLIQSPRVREGRRLREDGLRVSGWQIGWIDEIGSEAAVTNATRNVLVVATGDDGAPESLDEPVTVGLFRLVDDEWEETGVQLEFDAFEEAVGLGAKELERRLVRAENAI